MRCHLKKEACHIELSLGHMKIENESVNQLLCNSSHRLLLQIECLKHAQFQSQTVL